jgi:P pilus assembly chaperone PapD
MNNKAFLNRFFGALFGITVGSFPLFGMNPALAQVGLSPVVLQEEMVRNRAQSVLRVTNPSNAPIRIRVYSQPFTYEREVGFTYLTESEQDLTPYLQFSPREFVIPPGEEQRVRLIALFPPEMTHSEYRAVVFTETLAEDTAAAANTAGIQTRIGSTIYIRQTGEEAELSVIDAEWNAVTNQIDLLVSNEGGATARPDAHWSLLQGEETIASGKSGDTTVIAESDRVLRLPFGSDAELPASGTYNLTGELIWYFDSETFREPFSTTVTIP